MDSFSNKEITLILTHLIQRKTPSFYSQNLVKQKSITYPYRHGMISQLKKMTNDSILHMDNHLQIFYMSVLYLDIIISRNKFNFSSEKNRNLVVLTCFNLALKFLGIFDHQVNHIIKKSILNIKKSYSSCENKCLLMLNYNLIYTTIYDFINLLLPNNQSSANKRIHYLSKTILYSIIGCDSIMIYPPFLVSIGIIKFCKEYIGIKGNDSYEKFFNNDKINELVYIIKKEYNKEVRENKEFKDYKEVDEDSKNWDVKTMSSTVEEIKEIRTLEPQISQRSSMKYIPIKTESKIPSSHFRNSTLDKYRNNSATNNIRRNMNMGSFNIKKANVNNIKTKSDKINIDLCQMSSISLNKLAKLSIRYLKGQK